MPPLNLFDGIFLAVLIAAALIACARGLVREVIHTLLFIGAVVGISLYIIQNPSNPPASPLETTYTLAAMVIAAYIGILLLLRYLVPILMKDDHPVGLRSRLSGGFLAMIKVLVTAIFINIWYAAHTPLPHPDRLSPLPPMMQNSTFIQGADGTWTDPIYQALLDMKLLEPAASDGTADPYQAPEGYEPITNPVTTWE